MKILTGGPFDGVIVPEMIDRHLQRTKIHAQAVSLRTDPLRKLLVFTGYTGSYDPRIHLLFGHYSTDYVWKELGT